MLVSLVALVAWPERTVKCASCVSLEPALEIAREEAQSSVYATYFPDEHEKNQRLLARVEDLKWQRCKCRPRNASLSLLPDLLGMGGHP